MCLSATQLGGHSCMAQSTSDPASIAKKEEPATATDFAETVITSPERETRDARGTPGISFQPRKRHPLGMPRHANMRSIFVQSVHRPSDAEPVQDCRHQNDKSDEGPELGLVGELHMAP